MARRRKKSGKATAPSLTLEEVGTAAARMMAAAQAHQRAACWCLDKPDAKPPNVDSVFFSAVAFELILLSVEQSLRLLLLLQYSVVKAIHNPHALYGIVRRKSGGKQGIRAEIIDQMNALGQAKSIPDIAEKEMLSCLRKHNSSYSNFRYFELGEDARLSGKWEFLPRDVQILHCLALALIHLNMADMGRRGIGAFLSMSRIPESEMTDELKAIRDRLIGV